MKTFARPALAAAALILVAGCAGSSGQPWTPPPPATPGREPTPAATSPAPASERPSVPPAAEPPASPAPASPAPASAVPSAEPSVAPASPAPASPAPTGSTEPSAGGLIELELTTDLAIKQGGVKVTDIPVTPGETIIFRITNTAPYIHNLWIGPDQALMANQTAGLVGVPDWVGAEPRELVWVVPDDITGLYYGCTVPGHYLLMKGTFSLAQ